MSSKYNYTTVFDENASIWDLRSDFEDPSMYEVPSDSDSDIDDTQTTAKSNSKGNKKVNAGMSASTIIIVCVGCVLAVLLLIVLLVVFVILPNREQSKKLLEETPMFVQEEDEEDLDEPMKQMKKLLNAETEIQYTQDTSKGADNRKTFILHNKLDRTVKYTLKKTSNSEWYSNIVIASKSMDIDDSIEVAPYEHLEVSVSFPKRTEGVRYINFSKLFIEESESDDGYNFKRSYTKTLDFLEFEVSSSPIGVVEKHYRPFKLGFDRNTDVSQGINDQLAGLHFF